MHLHDYPTVASYDLPWAQLTCLRCVNEERANSPAEPKDDWVGAWTLCRPMKNSDFIKTGDTYWGREK